MQDQVAKNATTKKSARMRAVEEQWGKPLSLLIPALYNRHGNWQRVADELGVSRFTLWVWVERMGIETSRIAHTSTQAS